MPMEESGLRPDLLYVEELIRILIKDSKVLRDKAVELLKVLWQHRGLGTWKCKTDMLG